MSERRQSLAFLSHYSFDGEYDSGIAKIVCPFHDDEHPSLWVYVEQANAYCFACGWVSLSRSRSRPSLK